MTTTTKTVGSLVRSRPFIDAAATVRGICLSKAYIRDASTVAVREGSISQERNRMESNIPINGSPLNDLRGPDYAPEDHNLQQVFFAPSAAAAVQNALMH